jgi:hypothetical protein
MGRETNAWGPTMTEEAAMDSQTNDQAEPLQRIANSLDNLEKQYAEQLRQSALRMAELDKQRAKFEESRGETDKLLNRINIVNFRRVLAVAFLALIVAVIALIIAIVH